MRDRLLIFLLVVAAIGFAIATAVLIDGTEVGENRATVTGVSAFIALVAAGVVWLTDE